MSFTYFMGCGKAFWFRSPVESLPKQVQTVTVGATATLECRMSREVISSDKVARGRDETYLSVYPVDRSIQSAAGSILRTDRTRVVVAGIRRASLYYLLTIHY